MLFLPNSNTKKHIIDFIYGEFIYEGVKIAVLHPLPLKIFNKHQPWCHLIHQIVMRTALTWHCLFPMCLIKFVMPPLDLYLEDGLVLEHCDLLLRMDIVSTWNSLSSST